MKRLLNRMVDRSELSTVRKRLWREKSFAFEMHRSSNHWDEHQERQVHHSVARLPSNRDERYLLEPGEVIFFIGLAFCRRNLLDGGSRRQSRAKILRVYPVKSRPIR